MYLNLEWFYINLKKTKNVFKVNVIIIKDVLVRGFQHYFRITKKTSISRKQHQECYIPLLVGFKSLLRSLKLIRNLVFIIFRIHVNSSIYLSVYFSDFVLILVDSGIYTINVIRIIKKLYNFNSSLSCGQWKNKIVTQTSRCLINYH